MQEEIFIPIIVFSFILLLTKMVLDHAKWKRSNKDVKPKELLSDRSMSLSELEETFQRTVDAAVEPIDARMARVEKQLRRLSASEPQRMLPEGDTSETADTQ